jgi:hypothetical protein
MQRKNLVVVVVVSVVVVDENVVLLNALIMSGLELSGPLSVTIQFKWR